MGVEAADEVSAGRLMDPDRATAAAGNDLPVSGQEGDGGYCIAPRNDLGSRCWPPFPRVVLLPEAERSIRPPGHQAPPVTREGDRLDGRGMAGQSLTHLRRLPIPYLYRPVVAARREQFAIRRERYVVDGIDLLLELWRRFACLQVPHVKGLVVTPRSHISAVRGKRDGIDGAIVPGQGANMGTDRNVANDNLPVVVGTRDPLSIAGKDHARHRRPMTLHYSSQSASRGLPKLREPVCPAGGQ